MRANLIDPLLLLHNGRVANAAGDSLLLEFSSAVDAVRCANAVQKDMAVRNESTPPDQQIWYRMGINVGDVISEGDDLLGNGVNVAARLESIADPGGICLSRSVHEQIVGKFDLPLENLGEVDVKNLSRPVETFRIVTERRSTAAQARRAQRANKRGPRRVWMAAAEVIAVLGIYFWLDRLTVDFEPAATEAMALPLPERPSVVVLPFANLSNDPDQAVLADGITEDLITDLSKLSGLFVIGRNTSFAFRGQDVPISKVAEELGVRYVLTGSVRRSGGQIRITAQFLDALNGKSIWAERFDGAVSDVFATQDAFTLKVVEALSIELSNSETEQIRRQETDKLAAREAFQRGWELYSRFDEEANVQSVVHFEKAIELDPE